MKTFKYEITEREYLEKTDEHEDFVCDEFYYTVEYKDLLYALADILYELYFRKLNTDLSVKFAEKSIEGIKVMLGELDDLFDELVEQFDYELKEYFEREAREEYRLTNNTPLY